jgi:hypothetical protein
MNMPRLAGSTLLAAALALAACAPRENLFPGMPRDPVAQNPASGPYLFGYFLGNGDGLHLAYSNDGLKFTPLNDGNVYLRSDVGNQIMRDPCLRQGPDGIYRLTWTTGWWDKGLGVASSPDLIHWSTQLYIEVNKDNPTAVNTWAPELFYNDLKNEWMVFWATTIPERFTETQIDGGRGRSGPNGNQSLNHRIYCITSPDFVHFSDPKLLVDPGFNCIDATIVKIGTSDLPSGKYAMVIKDETAAPVAKKNLRVLLAENPEGPWGKASEPISPQDLWVEGPTVSRVGSDWIIYYDEYRNGRYGAIRSPDFLHWEAVKNLEIPKASHGTIFSVDPAVIARLQKTPPFVPPPVVRRSPETRGPPANPTSAPATAPK